MCAPIRGVVSRRTVKRIAGFDGPRAVEPYAGVPSFPVASFLDRSLPSGFVAPSAEVRKGLPCFLARSRNGGLPVYVEKRHGSSKVYTVIRNVRSSSIGASEGERAAAVEAFVEEVRAVLKGAAIVAHTESAGSAATIRVDGYHVPVIRSWLQGLGM